ncbi:MAG: DUF1559 domain-containing protein [Thermoguttaceae bacterium]
MRANRFLMAVSAVALLFVWPSYAPASDPGPAIDVSLATPDDFAAVVIHPRQIAQSPLVAESLKDEMIAGAIKKFGIDPSEVEQIVVLFRMVEQLPGHPKPSPIGIVHFTHDVNAKGIMAKFQAAEGSPGPHRIKEVQIGGKTCLDSGGILITFAPNKNTLIEAPRQIMEKVISGAEPNGPVAERLKKADATQDVLVVLAPEAFPDLDKMFDLAKKGVPPLVVNYLDAAKTVRGATAMFSLTGPRLLRVVLDAKDAEAAGNVEELLQQALRMASGGLALAKQSIPKEMRTTLDPLVKLADEFIDGGKAAKSGSQVNLDFKRPELLDTAGTRIVSAVTQSVLDAHAAARWSQQANNMRQISLAMLMYEQLHSSFPPAAIEKNGTPLLSWRVAILPFLEEDVLYKQFHLDEPWDSPHNREAAKRMPSVFRSPDSPSDGKTRVMLFTGKGAAFDGGKKVMVADIRDGMSNTILCAEAGPDTAVPWTKPEDLVFDPEKPLAALGKVSPRGFITAFFDGSVRTLKVDNETLKALITPDGGEVIDPSKLRGGR